MCSLRCSQCCVRLGSSNVFHSELRDKLGLVLGHLRSQKTGYSWFLPDITFETQGKGAKLQCMQRGDVVAFLAERFPPSLAEPWDRSGLQVGPLQAPCQTVAVALDFDLHWTSCLEGVDLLITHHPLLFRPLKQVLPETPLGQKLATLLRYGTACYAIHTPYDVAQGGLGEVLAEMLGLVNVRPLAPRGRLLKLVVYIPTDHVDGVAQALFAAGAGRIGRYGHCSFRAAGTGTFLPEEGAHPFVGQVGQEEHVAEVRLETIVPAERLAAVLAAMRTAHPYEEVAYDVYALENEAPLHGLGRVGDLPMPASAGEVAERFAQALGCSVPRVEGEPTKEVRRVAVCGGSGGELWRAAHAAGAELYLTGEMGYHHRCAAVEAGLVVAVFGHRETERPFVDHIARLVAERFPALKVVKG